VLFRVFEGMCLFGRRKHGMGADLQGEERKGDAPQKECARLRSAYTPVEIHMPCEGAQSVLLCRRPFFVGVVQLRELCQLTATYDWVRG
jgi:hypothetical protein